MTEATTYTMSKVATYEFKDSAFKGRKTGGHHHHHRRQTSNSSGQSVEDVDPTDGTGSLTYSATSSVQSGASAGESTDSSFADIMRVLDSQEGPELAALIKKEGISASEIREKHNRTATSAVSVASSLNYSTDGESALESALEGSHLIHTITGQPSDSYAFDGGGIGSRSRQGMDDGNHDNNNNEDDDAFSGGSNILFAPAEPAEVKRKKKDRRNSNGSSNSSRYNNSGHGNNSNHGTSIDTPRAKNGSSRKAYDDVRKQQLQPSAPSPTTVTSKVVATPSTPPHTLGPPPRNSPSSGGTPTSKKRMGATTTTTMVETDEEEDVWYAKWWMSCFPDAFRDLVPKR